MKIMCVNALMSFVNFPSRIDVASAPFESNRSDVRVKCCNIVRTLYKSVHISFESVLVERKYAKAS